MDFRNWQPSTLITNDIIEGYEYSENAPPIAHGRARGAQLGFCAYDSNGTFMPDIIMGKPAYDIVEKQARDAIKPFLDHLNQIFINDPRDADIFLKYMAFKMQYPGVKIRWGLVIAGEQGVGKDIAIDACWTKYGLNFVNNISPNDIMGGFNDYLKCLLLRVSEVADLVDANKWTFNERMKTIIAGAPDRTLINPKYGVKFWLKLHNGTIITTNHIDTGGVYIPEGDRRYYVMKCATWRQIGLYGEARAQYFDNLHAWFTTPDSNGVTGYDKIGHYLLWGMDISNFNVNACPEATKAKLDVQAMSNELPQFFLDALTSYGELANKQKGVCNGPINVFGCSQDNLPILVNVRTLTFLASEALNTEGAIKDKITPARLTYLLRQGGYSLLPNQSGGRKWYINGKFETFYYLSDVIADPKEIEESLTLCMPIYMQIMQLAQIKNEAAF